MHSLNMHRIAIATTLVLALSNLSPAVAQEAEETSSEVALPEVSDVPDVPATAESTSEEPLPEVTELPAETTEASAETTDPTEPAEDEDVEKMVVVGSRRVMRSALESPTPVDLVDAEEFKNQGSGDMDDLLRTVVPSYNVNAQPISDAATLIRPANLRGLPPDSTVVLVNGKRRHRGSVISFLGAGVSDGAHGVDLNPIPSLALKRVEVLRDGAAAQYGSDAIAGVMNFVLRDDPYGYEAVARIGSTYEGDGTIWSVAGNVGVPLTDSGFLNLTIEYGNADPTSRSIQRDDAKLLIENGNDAVANPAQIWGTPEVSDDIKFFANAGYEFSEALELYAFGNVAHREVVGGFYFRNPTSRSGVYSNDDGATLLVGDLTPNDGNDCPIVNITNGVLDPVAYQQVLEDPNCFAFNERFPGGFTPQFGGTVVDWSVAGGFKGQLPFGLRYDLSASLGSSEASFKIVNTVNASLGPDSPTEFSPGVYRELDQTYNFDLGYDLDIGTFSPLTIAAGVEFRIEEFTIEAGDEASYISGPLFDQGFSVGSNGFPGFSPEFAGTFDRKNIGAYLDFTTDIVESLTAQVAGRVEDFDSFGTQATVKASTRLVVSDLWQATDHSLAFRGSIGTGFRAPSAGQANVSNVTTASVVNDDGTVSLRNRGTIPPTNPIAQAVGAEDLNPETSVNITGGMVLTISEVFQLTADFYHIQVKDRISQSGDQTLTPEQAEALEASGVVGARNLQEFRFYTNAFDTTTMGLDVVATTEVGFGDAGDTTLTLAYSWNETQVDDFIEGVIDQQRIDQLQDSLPKHRLTGTVKHAIGPLRGLVRANYYSSWTEPENSGDFVYEPKVLFDVEVGYTLFDRFTLVAGAQNVLNTFPDEYPESVQGGIGAIYPQYSPIGFNGGFYYARLQASL